MNADGMVTCLGCGVVFKPRRPTDVRRMFCTRQCATNYQHRWPDSFWRKVEKTDSCWLWRGSLTASSYGTLGRKDVRQLAHRVSWQLTNGPIPNGLHVLHKCDVPKCVNPSHLFLGTHQDNMADKVAKGRSFNQYRDKPVCRFGHPYSGDNLRVNAKGYRECRICRRESQRKQNAKRALRSRAA